MSNSTVLESRQFSATPEHDVKLVKAIQTIGTFAHSPRPYHQYTVPDPRNSMLPVGFQPDELIRHLGEYCARADGRGPHQQGLLRSPVAWQAGQGQYTRREQRDQRASPRQAQVWPLALPRHGLLDDLARFWREHVDAVDTINHAVQQLL